MPAGPSPRGGRAAPLSPRVALLRAAGAGSFAIVCEVRLPCACRTRAASPTQQRHHIDPHRARARAARRSPGDAPADGRDGAPPPRRPLQRARRRSGGGRRWCQHTGRRPSYSSRARPDARRRRRRAARGQDRPLVRPVQVEPVARPQGAEGNPPHPSHIAHRIPRHHQRRRPAAGGSCAPVVRGAAGQRGSSARRAVRPLLAPRPAPPALQDQYHGERLHGATTGGSDAKFQKKVAGELKYIYRELEVLKTLDHPSLVKARPTKPPHASPPHIAAPRD